MLTTRIVSSGATGVVGRVILPAIIEREELELVAAMGRSVVGTDVRLARRR
jgi:hypothetical protein